MRARDLAVIAAVPLAHFAERLSWFATASAAKHETSSLIAGAASVSLDTFAPAGWGAAAVVAALVRPRVALAVFVVVTTLAWLAAARAAHGADVDAVRATLALAGVAGAALRVSALALAFTALPTMPLRVVVAVAAYAATSSAGLASAPAGLLARPLGPALLALFAALIAATGACAIAAARAHTGDDAGNEDGLDGATRVVVARRAWTGCAVLAIALVPLTLAVEGARLRVDEARQQAALDAFDVDGLGRMGQAETWLLFAGFVLGGAWLAFVVVRALARGGDGEPPSFLRPIGVALLATALGAAACLLPLRPGAPALGLVAGALLVSFADVAPVVVAVRAAAAMSPRVAVAALAALSGTIAAASVVQHATIALAAAAPLALLLGAAALIEGRAFERWLDGDPST